MRMLLLCGTVVSLALAPRVGAQLAPGTFVATTFHTTDGASNTVQTIDPFAGTATPLPVAGFPTNPSPVEIPDSVRVETPTSILLGTRSVGSAGNIYRATYSAGSWTATQLNTGSTMTESVAQIVELSSGIYYVGSPAGGTGGSGAFVGQMPAAGGSPAIYADLGGAGALGLGNAMAAVGTDLHVFTFDSTTTGPDAEHWKVDTTTGTMTLVGPLPSSVAVGFTASNFGAVQADYDPVSGELVVAGVYGDVLRRTPAGTNVLQIAPPGTGGTGANLSDALALNTNTGSVGIGDRAAHYEELSCYDNVFLNTYITMPPPVLSASRVSNLAYVASLVNYLPAGTGCAQSTGAVPCNYVNSLPYGGNPSFAITLQNAVPSTLAILGLGASNSTYLGTPLPADLTSLGAPGCFLRSSLEVIFFVPTSPSGTATFGPVPIPPGLIATLYDQWIVVNPAANALGAAFSDARRIDIQ